MKICAITMVYRDHWALAQWYGHYGRLVGAENLFVVAHGADPEIQRICPKASVITIPRDDLAMFDRERGQFLNTLQNALGRPYDWVIRTDVDELICLDPAIVPSLADMLAGQQAPALFSLGLNLVEVAGDAPMKAGQAAFSCRKHFEFSGHYSKAWIRCKDIALVRHGVQVKPRLVNEFPFVMPRGVYLAHLKFANRAEQERSDQHRIEIANSDAKGLPGRAWARATVKSARFYREFDAKPYVDWAEAEARAYTDLQTPLRSEENGVVRVASLQFEYRSQLPDWFATAG